MYLFAEVIQTVAGRLQESSHNFHSKLQREKRERDRIRSEVHRTVLLVCKIKLLFTFPLEYAIRRVQVSRDALQLHCTHQLVVYADGINIWEDACLLERETQNS
jgi:hypothetical protein